jgi:hypothetical protein
MALVQAASVQAASVQAASVLAASVLAAAVLAASVLAASVLAASVAARAAAAADADAVLPTLLLLLLLPPLRVAPRLGPGAWGRRGPPHSRERGEIVREFRVAALAATWSPSSSPRNAVICISKCILTCEAYISVVLAGWDSPSRRAPPQLFKPIRLPTVNPGGGGKEKHPKSQPQTQVSSLPRRELEWLHNRCQAAHQPVLRR